MIRIIFRKLAAALLTFVIIVVATFFLMKSIPGDPFSDDRDLPEVIKNSLMHHYELDTPLSHQLKRYFTSILKADFGPSFRYPERSVNTIIAEGFPVSFLLGAEAVFLSLGFGIFFGALSALYQNGWQDRALLYFATLGISIPSFIIATLFQWIFAYKLGVLPLALWGSFAHTVLPALALSAKPAAFIMRLIRTNFIEVLSHDYIHTARAKGLPSYKILIHHVLPQALLPLFPYIAPMVANILMGSFVIEYIFSIPGLGQWFVTSVSNRDYTAIIGLTVFYSLLLLSLSFALDLLYYRLDPRQKACAQ